MHPQENKWLALPRPLPPPTINPKLETFSALPRSVECLRHFVLSIEWWISPGGRLRQWIKWNVSLAAFLCIPAVFLMPIVSLVLHELDGWFSLLLSIVWKLFLLAVFIAVVALVIKSFPSSSKGSSRRRK